MKPAEDTGFAEWLLEAVIADQASKPRTMQRGIGPSGLGGCRELNRASIAGDPQVPPTEWGTAAHVGTVMGEDLERIMALAPLGARVQERVSTRLPRTGLEVAGNSDAIFVDQNTVTDLKSKDRLAGVRAEGPSIENCIQVSVYALGLVQGGVLTEGCSARLVYYDRSGEDQEFAVIPIEWEAILRFVELAEARLEDVMYAQSALEQGDLEPRHALRDKPPSYCFSRKVQCPFRFACWTGSEHAPREEIVHPDELAAVHKHLEAKRMKKQAEDILREARAELEGVSGRTPDGVIVSWNNKGRRLDVVATEVRPDVAEA